MRAWTETHFQRNNIFGPNCTVFVDNLALTVAEATLFKTFNKLGVISSARVVRDPHSGKSMGQAYLNFVDPVDAQRALKTMNGFEIDGQPIRIRRKKKETNLFVKNIHQDVTKVQLHDTFEKYGKLASCRIMRDKKGVSMGYGYVRYLEQEAADKAIDAAHCDDGIMIGEWKIGVSYYQTWKERNHEMKMNDHFFTCVHIKGIPESWEEKDLAGFIEKRCTGKIKVIPKVEISRKPEGTSKGYAFATFEEHEDAKKMLELMNDTEIDKENTLVVSRLMSNFERQQSMRQKYKEQKRNNYKMYKGRNLYVKNFPLDWEKEHLKDLFSKYGAVTSIKIMKNNSNISEGFGFVCFEEKTGAKRALESLNGVPIEGKPICVNHAELKESRKARLWANTRTPERGGYQGGWRGRPRGRPRTRGQGWRGRGRGRRGHPNYGYKMQPSEWMPYNVAHVSMDQVYGN